MFYTYILKSKNTDSYCIGSTQDIGERFKRHNKGIVKSTKRYMPWEILYAKEFETRSEAYKYE